MLPPFFDEQVLQELQSIRQAQRFQVADILYEFVDKQSQEEQHQQLKAMEPIKPKNIDFFRTKLLLLLFQQKKQSKITIT